jgi:DNA mismatch repair protein MutS
MKVFDEYMVHVHEFRAKYGEKTLVLIEVGSFWEFYAKRGDEETEAGLRKVCDLLNLQPSRKPDPVMAGFPSQTLPKYLDMLVAHEYTTVLVAQFDDTENNGAKVRRVTRVVSKGTYWDQENAERHANLVAVYESRTSGSFGMCVMDLRTGNATVLEPESLLELRQCMASFGDVEVLLSGGLTAKDIERTDLSVLSKERDAVYDTTVLRRVFKDAGMLLMDEYLGLAQAPLAFAAYGMCMSFAYDHDAASLVGIARPKLQTTRLHMFLSLGSLDQLNICHSSKGRRCKDADLLSLLNVCVTPMGRRLFVERLRNPLTDAHELTRRYDAIECLMQDTTCSGSKYKHINGILRQCSDVTRILRRMHAHRSCPHDVFLLFQTMSCAIDLAVCASDASKASKACAALSHVFRIEEAKQYRSLDACETNIFQDCQGLEEYYSAKDGNQLDAFVGKFNEAAGKLIYKSSTSDGFHLTTTLKRQRDHWPGILSSGIHGLDLSLCQVRPIGTSHSIKLFHPRFAALEQEAQDASRKAAELLRHNFDLEIHGFLNINSDMEESIIAVCDGLAELDVHATCARNACERALCKPCIKLRSKAFVDAERMRHPLIEAIHEDVEYITNDVRLGCEHDGMLLYGLNASGKSSLMKALGVNVVLAQAGMFVACKSLAFSPYDALFTRIGMTDNLHRGQSTFVVEMSELRLILRQADENSLVLGDELCSGTETVSAVSIVASSVLSLAGRKSSFIFATHLHELPGIRAIESVTADNVCVRHMRVTFDDRMGVLVYDRVLHEGGGDTLYGLEVCRSLDMGEAFLEVAGQIRCQLLTPEGKNSKDKEKEKKGSVKALKSAYNRKLVVDLCHVCGKREHIQTHHIQEQELADSNNIIDARFNKNRLSNVVALCATCHAAHHRKDAGLHIGGFVATSNGVMLRMSLNESEIFH